MLGGGAFQCLRSAGYDPIGGAHKQGETRCTALGPPADRWAETVVCTSARLGDETSRELAELRLILIVVVERKAIEARDGTTSDRSETEVIVCVRRSKVAEHSFGTGCAFFSWQRASEGC